jgi:MFS family permease
MDPKAAPTQTARRLPLFAMLGATAISRVGNVLTSVAIPWFVLQTTGSAVRMGLVGGAISLAAVLAGLFGGPIVDRLGFRRTSVLADLMSGTTVAAIPLLYGTIGLEFWQLLLLVFLGAFLDMPGITGRQSLVPDLSRMAGMPVERANSAYQAIERASFLVGPPLAGVLIALLGTSNVLLLDAATFAVSAAAIAVAVPRPVRTFAERTSGGYLAELFEGLSFVRRDALILSIVVVAAVLNALDSPVFSVVLPVYADTNFGSAVALGTMIGGFGAGSLVGAVLFGAVGHRLPRRATLIAGWVLVGLPFWALAAEPSLPLSVAALFVSGLAAGPLNPIIFTVVQERTPEEMRGRVIGALWAAALAATPLGMAAGFALELVGLRLLLMGIAACYLVVTLGMLLNPALRQMSDPATDGPGRA